MVGDKPVHGDILNDVLNIKLVMNNTNKSVNIPNFLITKSLSDNMDNFRAYFTKMGKNPSKYSYIFKDFKIANLKKSGIKLLNGVIIDYRLMNINDTHIQEYDRDFLGFYLEINIFGEIKFDLNNNLMETIKFQFTKQPILSLKSENGLKNENNKKNCELMIKKFSGKNINPIFL